MEAPPFADQSAPRTFAFAAPPFAAAGGVLLLVAGSAALRTGYAEITLLLTHLATLGFLGAAGFGAAYAVAPLVSGAPVPLAWSRRLVLLSLVVGLAILALVLGGGWDVPLHVGFGFAELAALWFAGTLLWTLRGRAGGRVGPEEVSVTRAGLRLALAVLLVVVLLGTVMERALGGDARPGARAVWLQVHLTLAILGWVGALVIAVSGEGGGAFAIVSDDAGRARRRMLAGLFAGLLATGSVLGLHVAGVIGEGTPDVHVLATLAAAPAAAAVWIAHPWWALARLMRRPGGGSGRGDVRCWRAGLLAAPVAAACGAWAGLSDDARAPVLFGWVALWGWAGTIAHGLVLRLVAPRVDPPPDGRLETPSRLAYLLHVASVPAGAAAIVTGVDVLARATGLLVVAAAAALFVSLRRRAGAGPPPPLP